MKEGTPLTPEQNEVLLALLLEQDNRHKYNKLKYWWDTAYPWQVELRDCTGSAAQILAMCANQIGKTTTGAAITACHLTGKYPEGYKGHKFEKPINAWACGISNETTRDILQGNLLGIPGNPEAQGTGFVPREDILDTTRKPQVPNAIQTVLVQHYNPYTGNPNGVSRLDFKAYEQGETKFMGRPMDWIWLDEQPAASIYTQCITRTVATAGIVMMTFTPEDGMTKVIHQFLHDIKKGQYLLSATWDDAPHLDKDRKEQLLSQYSPAEALMRSTGKPIFGSGPVFMVPDEDVLVEPFEIPSHWPKICGIDFGWEHPTAAVWLAWDRDSDTVYQYAEYRQNRLTAQQHAPAIKARGQWVPCVWPHDGMSHEKGSGLTLADQYRSQGLNMTIDHFRNPPAPGSKGKGDIKIEPGINALHQAMQNSQFKVFNTCTQTIEEKNQYHRVDGVIYAVDDDLMSALRYAFQSRHKYAKTQVESDANNRYAGVSLPVISRGVV